MEFIPNIPSLRISKLKTTLAIIGAVTGSALLGSSAIHNLSRKEDTSHFSVLEKQHRENISLNFENRELTNVVQIQNELLKELCKEYEWKDTKFNMRCEEDIDDDDELE